MKNRDTADSPLSSVASPLGSVRRQYSDDDKTVALVFYDACKANLSKAARLSQIPRNTLRRWVSERTVAVLEEQEEAPPSVATATLERGVESVAKTSKGEVLKLWEGLRDSCFKDLKAARLEAQFRDLVAAAKIATDMRLTLRGTYDDEDIEDLLAEFVAIVKKHVTDEPTQAALSEELRRSADRRRERT